MQSFVSIDFETANENRGSACSVGLIRYVDGVEQESFTTLLRPIEELNYFSWRNINVHGITPDDVVGAPEWSEVDGEIRDLIGDLPIVAHNMAFDGYVLSDLAGLYGLPTMDNRRFCTLRLARKVLAEIPQKRLNAVFGHYFPHETFQHHEALADARACGMIFSRMIDDYGVDELERLCPPTGLLKTR
ncbi:3'-5' exonuclease [Flaviflexus massiliensis]|uniref:3'-5' exonuclease n=1 Tax=Flaviflexus massiliensis TaxID=1522309 RepID=UPI0006D56F03|nr:3'-5' exonuclease [Flaviflexus massiliensis]